MSKKTIYLLSGLLLAAAEQSFASSEDMDMSDDYGRYGTLCKVASDLVDFQNLVDIQSKQQTAADLVHFLGQSLQTVAAEQSSELKKLLQASNFTPEVLLGLEQPLDFIRQGTHKRANVEAWIEQQNIDAYTKKVRAYTETLNELSELEKDQQNNADEGQSMDASWEGLSNMDWSLPELPDLILDLDELESSDESNSIQSAPQVATSDSIDEFVPSYWDSYYWDLDDTFEPFTNRNDFWLVKNNF